MKKSKTHEANPRVASGLPRPRAIDCDLACDGETALEMVCQKKYDLVFISRAATQRLKAIQAA